MFDEHAGFGFADLRQLVPPDLPRLAAIPLVRPPGVWVDAECDDHLSARQQLDLLIGAAVRADQARGDLLERRVGPKRDGALGRATRAHDDGAAISEPL